MKKKKRLKTIEVQIYDTGFTVWIKEKGTTHWILDGSNVKNDGKIHLGQRGIWKMNAEYKEEDNTIRIKKNKWIASKN